MKYRLLAFDLDGTLLDSSLNIRQDSLESIKKAKEQGLEVVIVTGRHHTAVEVYWQTLDLNTPAICCNGSYAYDFTSQHYLPEHSPLPKNQALEVINLANQYAIPCLLYTDKDINYQQNPITQEHLQRWIDRSPQGFAPKINETQKLDEVAKKANLVWKFVCMHQDEKLLALFSKAISSKLGLNSEFSGKKQLDIMQAQTNKGSTLIRLIEHFNVKAHEVLAIGDQENDIQMLKSVGMGIAMGNGTEAVKQCAKWVTATNDEGGIAKALDRFVLNC